MHYYISLCPKSNFLVIRRIIWQTQEQKKQDPSIHPIIKRVYSQLIFTSSHFPDSESNHNPFWQVHLPLRSSFHGQLALKYNGNSCYKLVVEIELEINRNIRIQNAFTMFLTIALEMLNPRSLHPRLGSYQMQSWSSRHNIPSCSRKSFQSSKLTFPSRYLFELNAFCIWKWYKIWLKSWIVHNYS